MKIASIPSFRQNVFKGQNKQTSKQDSIGLIKDYQIVPNQKIASALKAITTATSAISRGENIEQNANEIIKNAQEIIANERDNEPKIIESATWGDGKPRYTKLSDGTIYKQHIHGVLAYEKFPNGTEFKLDGLGKEIK